MIIHVDGWAILIIILFFWFLRTYKVYSQGNFILRQELTVQMFFFYLLCVGYLTMQPFHFQIPFTTRGLYFDYHLFYNLRHMADGYLAYQLLYSVGNVILFIPLGFLLPFLNKRLDKFLWIGFIGLLGSLTIETVQALFTISRRGTVDDLVFNTFGAVIGYLFFCGVKMFRRRIIYFKSSHTNFTMDKKIRKS